MTDPVPSKDQLRFSWSWDAIALNWRISMVDMGDGMLAGYDHLAGYYERRLIEEIERLRTALRGIQSCSTCEACRGAATLALGGATPEPRVDLKRYFQVTPVAVADEPKACRVDFHVGVQTIPIGPEYCEDRDHADWWIDVICKALRNVIAACSTQPPPVAQQPTEHAIHGGRIMTLRECMDAEDGGE